MALIFSSLLALPFSRYDSLTGVPSHQRALAFEKGSVLFNIGALHTQIGARQDRASLPGLNQAIDAFQKAAGMYVFLLCFLPYLWVVVRAGLIIPYGRDDVKEGNQLCKASWKSL